MPPLRRTLPALLSLHLKALDRSSNHTENMLTMKVLHSTMWESNSIAQKLQVPQAQEP